MPTHLMRRASDLRRANSRVILLKAAHGAASSKE